MSTFKAHEGILDLAHSFFDAWNAADPYGSMRLETSTGSSFRVLNSVTSRGLHKGEKTLRFLKGKQEFARAYPCCWDHYYNCNRTRIGMYCIALDEFLSGVSIGKDVKEKDQENVSASNHMKDNDIKRDVDLARMFSLIEETLYSQSRLSREDLSSTLEYYKKLDYRKMTDDEIFWNMVKVAFYSGFKAATVSNKLPRIREYFSDYNKVKDYADNDHTRISQDPGIIRNRRKITAISWNAKIFDRLVKKNGSFVNYMESFRPLDDDLNLTLFRYDLRKNFRYLGPRTVYHFMTDLGLNVLKPDRVICRILYRLGMIGVENDIDRAVQVGRQISVATGHPIRYIDIVLVKYGQKGKGDKFGLLDGVCLKNSPRCNICGVRQHCNFG